MKLAVATVLAATASASATYQKVSGMRDRRRFPPPGRLVDIGGRRLHLVEAGAGTPAVVVIPALADNALQWLPVLEACAGETLMCAYDRAETGWSDPPASWRRTPDTMATDLRALLAAAGIPVPCILVGHSIGGLVARRLASQHPDLVAGMLLIDSSHEQQADRLAELTWRRGRVMYLRFALQRQARILGVRRLASDLGLMRELDADIAREAPAGHTGAYRAILLSSRQRRTAVREMLMAAHTWGPPPELGDIPLTVITRAASQGWDWPAWARMQDELAGLSSDSEHIRAQKAGHYVHLDEPELVTRAILDLVRRCRQAQVSARAPRGQSR
jgi:pimeloyl-ACP methyl ester carboxylesterase